MSNFWGCFFHVFRGKKNVKFFLKNILVSALKSCIKWLIYDNFGLCKYFLKNHGWIWSTCLNWRSGTMTTTKIMKRLMKTILTILMKVHTRFWNMHRSSLVQCFPSIYGVSSSKLKVLCFRKWDSFFKSPNLPKKLSKKRLSWAWSLKFPLISVKNLFKFEVQDSFLE